MAEPMHAPLEHVSPLVQPTELSLHAAVERREAAVGRGVVQVSMVHALLSLHALSTVVETQPVPGWQASVVQPTPSSHMVLSARLEQTPFVVLQVSTVHEMSSLQSLFWVQPVPHSPPVQVPAEPALSVQVVPSTTSVAEQPVSVHTSVVHSLPSSQDASSRVCALQTPVATLQVLEVQATSSAQSWSTRQPLEQTPAVQVPEAPPASVQAVPSTRLELSQPVAVQSAA